MHYRDGTQAHLGDIARGRGYNLPHDVQGVGRLTCLESCSIHLRCCGPRSRWGRRPRPTR